GLHVRVETAATHFHGHGWSHAVGATGQAFDDGAGILKLRDISMVDSISWRFDGAGGAKNTEIGSGHGGGESFANVLCTFGNSRHRVDDAEHGRHDADAGQ